MINLVIYGFNELREHLKSENKDLYAQLVRELLYYNLIKKSKISFTTLLLQ
jgi:hypothetical protein